LKEEFEAKLLSEKETIEAAAREEVYLSNPCRE
jgi:cell division protein FtsB